MRSWVRQVLQQDQAFDESSISLGIMQGNRIGGAQSVIESTGVATEQPAVEEAATAKTETPAPAETPAEAPAEAPAGGQN